MRFFYTFSMAVALSCAAAVPAAAATQIKIATVAPDGTAWMREMRAAGEAIKKSTDGRVELKFYPGGVMGDAATVLRKFAREADRRAGGKIRGSVHGDRRLRPTVWDCRHRPLRSLR
jgi:TRAP-type C4-dicarboxylate transport system substrate-binding protein